MPSGSFVCSRWNKSASNIKGAVRVVQLNAKHWDVVGRHTFFDIRAATKAHDSAAGPASAFMA